MALLGSGGRVQALADRLAAPVDVASLAFFRVLFGAILTWEVCRYLAYGWIDRYYVEPDFHFTYLGFDWVQPLPGWGMTALFVAMGGAGLMVTVGLFYRAAVLAYGLGFTYVFLLDQANYLNHIYLLCMLCGMMAVVPAHRAWSLDARRDPGLARCEVSGGGLWMLRLTLALIYFYAGLAKINPDWLRAQPMLTWMEGRSDTPLIGGLLAHDATAWALSYGGLALDLAIGPALLWRRTRPYAIAVGVGFHLSNHFLFSIGIFPWLMMGAMVLFVEPERPRAWVQWLLGWGPAARAQPVSPGGRRLQLGLLALWLTLQALLPLRHLLYPGRPSWTEEGHKFAWHMKLRSKRGTLRYKVVDLDTGKKRRVDPADHLSKRQARKVKSQPDVIVQFAHELARRAAAEGQPHVAVFAETRLGLNGRALQPLIDPDVDLTQVRRGLAHDPWLLPLTEPLPGWDW